MADGYDSITDVGRFAASCADEFLAEHVLTTALKHAIATRGPESNAVCVILMDLKDLYEREGNSKAADICRTRIDQILATRAHVAEHAEPE